MADKACPVVIGTPRVVYSAFTKEHDLFAQAGVDYIDDSVNTGDIELLTSQLYATWGERLGITADENSWATTQALAALEEFRLSMEHKGKEILDWAKSHDEVVLLMIGRPYHTDPGLNHDVLSLFQELGFRILSMNSLPKDETYLESIFGNDVRNGYIEDYYDIRDELVE